MKQRVPRLQPVGLEPHRTRGDPGVVGRRDVRADRLELVCRLQRERERHRGPGSGRRRDELIPAVRETGLEIRLEPESAGAHQPRPILDSTRELGQHILSAPPSYYQTRIAFLSWLNGKQPGFQMVGGLHSGRSVVHLSKTFELADQAGLITNPALAAFRLSDFLRINGGEYVPPGAAVPSLTN